MINGLYKIFNFVLIFSTVLSGWTFIILLSNSNYNEEIKETINEMYSNQKEFIFNIKDLSIFLVKDANIRFNHKDNSELNNTFSGEN